MTKVQVAIAQSAPVPLAISAGIEKAERLVREALSNGANLIAFGETWLGGYPLWLDEAPGAALWDHPGTRALHRILLEHAVTADDARFANLQSLCDDHGVTISIGAHERVRTSLYNTQFLFRQGTRPLLHRKLVPTHGERLIWARGDGSTIDIHQADWGRIGSLICWEHWMPLARAAMHNLGEAVHVAAWPTVRETYALASRHYAFEGRCFVLAAGLIQGRDDLLAGLKLAGGNDEAKALIEAIGAEQLNCGGSLIVAPDGSVVATAGAGEELLQATLDLSVIGEALAALDTDGHYSRPDVFTLSVDRSSRDGVVWSN